MTVVPSNGSRADWWKTVALTLAAVLISVGGSWSAFGRDTVSQAQVRNIVDTTSPYALDRAGISQHFSTIDSEIASLQVDLHEQALEHSSLQGRIATLSEQIRELRKGR